MEMSTLGIVAGHSAVNIGNDSYLYCSYNGSNGSTSSMLPGWDIDDSSFLQANPSNYPTSIGVLPAPRTWALNVDSLYAISYYSTDRGYFNFAIACQKLRIKLW